MLLINQTLCTTNVKVGATNKIRFIHEQRPYILDFRQKIIIHCCIFNLRFKLDCDFLMSNILSLVLFLEAEKRNAQKCIVLT